MTAKVGQKSQIARLAGQLREIAGDPNVCDDKSSLDLASQDIWRRARDTVVLVVRPRSTEEVARVAAAIHAAGLTIAPRGGGMSYTSAYTPETADTVSLDLSRLNRVIALNAEDMTVTVEAGCTWMQLYDTLKPHGLRTPFWGTLSGRVSTIGGGLSQQGAMFGAGQHGATSESVVALTVVLGDGRVLRTGSVGSSQGAPSFRHHGPDLAGLFCGDCGVLGIKTEITLRLMRIPPYEDHLSFAFKTAHDLLIAMAEVARAGLAAETCAFDPNLVRIRMKRTSLTSDVKALQAVAGAERSLVKGLADAARIALTGRDFLEDDDYPLHMTCEARSAAALDADMAAARQIAAAARGREIENTIPKVMRANPFPPLNAMIGPNGERWAPVHGIVSHSAAPKVFDAIEHVFAEMADKFFAQGVFTAYLLSSFSTNALVIEPMFFWPEARMQVHETSVAPSHLARIKSFAPNAAAVATVAEARERIVAIFAGAGACHLQIGCTYPYRESLNPVARALLDAIKLHLDPAGALNPGCLGLDPARRAH